jgi:hypothetical protein
MMPYSCGEAEFRLPPFCSPVKPEWLAPEEGLETARLNIDEKKMTIEITA